jgi:hypothetical protein
MAENDKVTAVEKFQKLCALATNDGAPDNEKRNAAIKAVNMLGEGGELAVVPRSELEELQKRVEGASASLAKIKEARNSGMIMGGIMGLVLGGKNGFLK